MARKFQIKRGLKAGMPTLAQGEFAMTTDAGSEGVFIGTGTENIELARKSDLDAIPTPDVSGQINTHNTDSSAHSDIRSSITTHTGNTSIHVTSDQKTAWDAKIDVTDIVNNLKTNASDKPLSAAMGVALEAYVLEQDDLMYEKLVPKTRKVNGKALSSNITLSASDISADPSGSAAKALTDAKSYTDTKIAAIPTPDVSGQISTHNTNTEAHNDIRKLITGLTTRLNALADSDDATLDQLSEIVAYIKNNKSLIDGITTSKVNVADIINNLTTNVSNKPLSAAQGVALKALIDAITVPTKVSELTNDSGYLTSFTETDPTVPAWAKSKSKPSYTASEVGAVPTSRTVNGKALSANITLSASDVGLGNVGNFKAVSTVASQGLSDTEKSNARANIGAGTSSLTIGTTASTAAAGNHTHTAANVGAVPTSRKVNGKALSSDITLSASDVGARPSSWTPSASDVGAVPTSRTVNGKALSSNITLAASDVGAAPASHTSDTAVHVTAEEKTAWNAKADAPSYGTEDLEAGTSSLETGKLYFVYE